MHPLLNYPVAVLPTYREGQNFEWELLCRGKFCAGQGGGFHNPWTSKTSNCLTATQMYKFRQGDIAPPPPVSCYHPLCPGELRASSQLTKGHKSSEGQCPTCTTHLILALHPQGELEWADAHALVTARCTGTGRTALAVSPFVNGD